MLSFWVIIHDYQCCYFQFVVYAAALWSALHGLVGVLDVQICNNMINIQAGYLKYKYKYKWLYKYNILLPPLKLETLFILFLNSFGAKRLLCLIMLNCFTGFGAKYGSGWLDGWVIPLVVPISYFFGQRGFVFCSNLSDSNIFVWQFSVYIVLWWKKREFPCTTQTTGRRPWQ